MSKDCSGNRYSKYLNTVVLNVEASDGVENGEWEIKEASGDSDWDEPVFVGRERQDEDWAQRGSEGGWEILRLLVFWLQKQLYLQSNCRTIVCIPRTFVTFYYTRLLSENIKYDMDNKEGICKDFRRNQCFRGES